MTAVARNEGVVLDQRLCADQQIHRGDGVPLPLQCSESFPIDRSKMLVWIHNFELFAQAVHPLALLGILRPRRARFKLADHKDAQPNGSIA